MIRHLVYLLGYIEKLSFVNLVSGAIWLPSLDVLFCDFVAFRSIKKKCTGVVNDK